MGTVWQAQWDGYPHVLPWLLNSKVEWSEPWACLGQVGWEGSVLGCSGHHAAAPTGGTSVPSPLAGLGKARGMYAVEGGWKKARQRAEKPALLSELSQVAHNNAVMAQECMFCPWLSATWHHSGLSPRAAFPSMPCRTLKGGFHVVVILTGFLPHQLPLLPLQPSKTHDTLLSYSKEFHSSTLYNRTAPKKPTIPLVLKQACWRLFFCLFCGGFVCLFVFTKMCNSQLLAGREPVLLAGELLRAKALGHSPVRAAQGPSTSYLPSTSLHWVLCQEYWWALGLVCYWALRAQQAGNWCLHRFFCIS